MLRNFLLVALGGAVGSMIRYGLALLIPRSPDTSLPWSTLLVNLTGSLMIGMIAGLATRNSWFSGSGYLLLATGLCGGFTTFSSLSLESIQMMERGRFCAAFCYVSISFVFGIALCFAGYKTLLRA